MVVCDLFPITRLIFVPDRDRIVIARRATTCVESPTFTDGQWALQCADVYSGGGGHDSRRCEVGECKLHETEKNDDLSNNQGRKRIWVKQNNQKGTGACAHTLIMQEVEVESSPIFYFKSDFSFGFVELYDFKSVKKVRQSFVSDLLSTFLSVESPIIELRNHSNGSKEFRFFIIQKPCSTDSLLIQWLMKLSAKWQ